MDASLTPLHRERLKYTPKLPPVFRQGGLRVVETPAPAHAEAATLKELFPQTMGLPLLTFTAGASAAAAPVKVGVLLSGGQAPGGHNVIAGLLDGLLAANPQSQLIGFLGGPIGLVKNKSKPLTKELLAGYRNTGGFDLIGSGRDKIEKLSAEKIKELQDKGEKVVEPVEAAKQHCTDLALDALVIIGGDDSNTNACVLAEAFLKAGVKTRVIGCPKTIDGDLKNEWVEVSFGFDTACRVYAELIGNIARDALSAKKYYHFIKLMGRSASHIALECALRTHPNVTLVSEEVLERKQTLEQIVAAICDAIAKRAEQGKNYGVVLIPEGLIEFVPECRGLIGELNDLLGHQKATPEALAGAADAAALTTLGLTAHSAAVYASLPKDIRQQLVLDRDDHGNVQVSRINTEVLLLELVQRELKRRKAAGTYKGKFSGLNHFFGYEGRCAAPGNFDADYCYSLGYTAAALVGSGRTGYLAAVRNLTAPSANWQPAGIPLTTMMTIERRHGKHKPVIKKALVELKGKPFAAFASQRDAWAVEDAYVYPGPIQYFGPTEVCDQPPTTLTLERG